MKTQTKESIWTGWKGALAVILFAVIMALLFCSCSSKSGQLMQTKYEKCVVLDTSFPTYYILNYSEGYEYRIQRIENQGTITTMYNPNLWHTGDTILLRFSQIVNEDN
jgi:hypothetical protein